MSVVVPVYNGAAFLEELTSRVAAVLGARNAPFEIVLVNDGSRDESWNTIVRLSRERPFVRGINLMRNYGQHNALLAGVRDARHEIVVTIDDDLQHPPEEIPKVVDHLAAGFDLVYGAPRNEHHDLWRRLTSRILKKTLQVAMGIPNARHLSAFRAFRTEIRNAFVEFRGPFVSLDVLLTWGTNRIGFVEVEHHDRAAGTSNYTLWRLLREAGNLLTGFSVLPLQVASVIGFTLTLFGIAVLVWVLGRYVALGGSIPGFPFLASIIAIFSGSQLFAIGIIGEYLARMHFRIMDRPSYGIRDVTERERA